MNDMCANELGESVRLTPRGKERFGLFVDEHVKHCKFEDRNFDSYFFLELKSF